MKGSECRLIEYMEGSKKRFIIPVYQRNYEWKLENCKQLFDDLVKVTKNKRTSHFFGSIVSVFEPSGRNTEFLVIDGQQRLTTVSLLLLAMYNLIKNNIIIPDDKYLGSQIYEDFLVDKYKPDETRIKLKPVKNDQRAFGKLFEEENDFISDSKLTVNYFYFYNRIQKGEISIDELFEAICRLEIINITLNNEDDPQLIFESLNSTGLDLTEGDKIRNYVLMGLPRKEQSEFYEKYWNRIEECTKYDVSSFVRDYLSVKQQVIPSQKLVYTSFKTFAEPTSIQKAEELLKELLSYAKRYEILLKGGINKELKACIYRLNRIETTVTRPFFLEVLRLFDEGKITISEVTEIFSVTESYIFRRTICDLPTNALNKIFLMLHTEIIKYDGSDSNYVEKFKYALLAKKEKARFPVNEEFIEAFSNKQVYLMNSKNKIYILERIENNGTAEDKDVYSHCDDGIYSIEHIMPQHLTPAWIKELGDNYEHIHEIWLHRIANLTLTAYNTKYSNYSFDEKKKMKNGFLDSGIRMNTYIAQKDKWTIEELEERTKHLANIALNIWSIPSTDFKPKTKQLDSYTLDDDTDLSGRVIARFCYKNTEQPVSSWAEMFRRVIQILYSEDKTPIVKLLNSDEESISSFFSTNKAKFIRCEEIGDGIFASTNTNTQTKISILSRLFELYDINPIDLVFYLRDEIIISEEEIGTRYEIRRNYWSFALKIIKEAHLDNNCFSNVNPTKENWINGFFGINGFNICCVANYDSARVELYFGKSSKEENKKAYDSLLANKNNIENSLGVSLIWSRGDDNKSSKVYYQLNDVSIENETDWLQMATFHATWSKKFYDIIVPYIVN